MEYTTLCRNKGEGMHKIETLQGQNLNFVKSTDVLNIHQEA